MPTFCQWRPIDQHRAFPVLASQSTFGDDERLGWAAGGLERQHDGERRLIADGLEMQER